MNQEPLSRRILAGLRRVALAGGVLLITGVTVIGMALMLGGMYP